MSEVKRYKPHHWRMEPDDEGQYVLHSDYAAVKAERDELARAVLRDTTHMCGGKYYCNGCGANVTSNPAHLPGCPVALAERITKETGDGR